MFYYQALSFISLRKSGLNHQWWGCSCWSAVEMWEEEFHCQKFCRKPKSDLRLNSHISVPFGIIFRELNNIIIALDKARETKVVTIHSYDFYQFINQCVG